MAGQITPTSSIQTTSQQSSEIVNYQPRRTRGLISQIVTLVLQPGYFFRTFPVSRQWIMIAILIIGLSGFEAIRQQNAASATNTQGGGEMMPPMDMGGMSMNSGGFSAEMLPPDFAMGGDMGGAGTTSEPSVRDTTLTAIMAAGSILLAWFIQTILLCEVSLFKGKAPSLGKNLQIAVWATVPIAFMIIVRLLYLAMGGTTGETGVVALLDEWEGFANLAPFLQNVIYAFLANITLFWLWNALLLYLGSRYALQGNSFVAFLVVAQWVIVAVVLPVVTGAIVAPVVANGGI